MTQNVKSCHSLRSQQICYSSSARECQQCPQQAACAQETRRRLNVNQPVATMPVTASPVNYATNYTQPYQATGYTQHSILLFDPRPEEGEGVFERCAKNGLQAGILSGVQSFVHEFIELLRRTKWK